MKYVKTFENNDNDDVNKHERFARELMTLSDMVVSNIDNLLKKIDMTYHWHFKGFITKIEEHGGEEIDLDDYIINIIRKLDIMEKVYLSDVILRYTIIIKKPISNEDSELVEDVIYDGVHLEDETTLEWINRKSDNINLLKKVTNKLSPKFNISYINYMNENYMNENYYKNSMLVMIDYDLNELSNSVNNATFKMNG